MLISIPGLLVALKLTDNLMGTSLAAGTVELWLTKPIGRVTFMLTRFAGALLLIAIICLLLYIPFALGLFIQTGIYNLGFVVGVPVFLFYFACLYCIVILISILRRKPAGTLNALLILGLSYLCGFMSSDSRMATDRARNKTMHDICKTGYAILPKFPELSLYTTQPLGYLTNIKPSDTNPIARRGSRGSNRSSTEYVFLSSAAFVIAITALAGWIFSRKDY